MADFVQVSEYREQRMALVIANPGPQEVFLSTSMADVSGSPPLGIHLAVNAVREFSWQLHGELCWQIWYANCTATRLLAWEWFGIPTIEPCVLTPNRSMFDVVKCDKPQLVSQPRRVVLRPPMQHRILINNLLSGVTCDNSGHS